MKGLRSVIFVSIFFILAAVIGYGIQKLCVAMLPNAMLGTMTHVYKVGINCLALDVNICGILGLIISYIIVTYVVKK